MAIYIDSANLTDVEAVQAYGWVYGVTTNPLLLARATYDTNQVLRALATLKFKQIFYQLVSIPLDQMYKEAKLVFEIVGKTLVLKVPPTKTGYQFVARYREQFPCCITAVFSPAQALVAREAGARYVAIYVNRATHQMGNGLQLVQDVARILNGSETKILAASIKSTDEACESLFAGAHHLTLPYQILTDLMINPLSEQAIADFQISGLV